MNGHGKTEVPSYLTEPLAQCDPEMYELIRKEKQRQVGYSNPQFNIHMISRRYRFVD